MEIHANNILVNVKLTLNRPWKIDALWIFEGRFHYFEDSSRINHHFDFQTKLPIPKHRWYIGPEGSYDSLPIWWCNEAQTTCSAGACEWLWKYHISNVARTYLHSWPNTFQLMIHGSDNVCWEPQRYTYQRSCKVWETSRNTPRLYSLRSKEEAFDLWWH